MNGIREPHQLGQIAGYGTRVLPHIRRGFQAFKGLFGKTVPKQAPFTKVTPRTKLTGEDIYSTKFAPGGAGPTKNIFQTTEFQPTKFGKYMAGTPEWAAAKGIYAGKGIITKPIKYALKSPLLTGAGLVWAGNKWVWGDGTPASDAEIAKITGGQHGPFDHTDKKKIKKAQDAFAEAQKDTRVKKYLDMMGYDRSKKTAVADALIDASKIVSDRGTLETKNITQELINPIIQATSKRFDKPEQIREAVGLMTVKAAIEKDLEDPQVKKLRALQIEKGELDLEQGFETDIRNLLLSRKDKVNKATLERYARLTADKYGEPFTVVDEKTVIGKEPGIYMVEDKIFRVDENGQAKQIA
jgi:hypothetical protein